MGNFRSIKLFRFIDKILYKRLMCIIPHALKYKIVTAWQLTQPPYHLVKEGDVVIQIGASGRLCPLGRSQPVIYSQIVGKTGQVFVFEVLPENVVGLESYIKAHNISNIQCQNIGLWKEEGTVEFDAPKRMATGSFIRSVRPDRPEKFHNYRQLPVNTLDNLTSQFNLTRLDVVNMTINGAEGDVLSGGMKTITRFRPALSMPFPTENEDYVRKTLSDLGYKMYDGLVKLYFIGPPFHILWADPK